MKNFYYFSIVFIFLIKIVKSNDEYSIGDDSNGTERILSRRRRYLTFPEGSSVQLVYDQTLPTVSTKFYFTIAVTAALAWELPSEPFHKITQDYKDRLKSGELKRKDENSTNLLFTNSNPIIYEMNKHNYYYSSPPRRNGNYNNNRNDSAGNYIKPNKNNFVYNLSNYLGNKNGNTVNYYANKLKDISEATSPLKWTRSDWMDLVKTMSYKNKPIKKYKTNIKEPRHYIYPVFGRRKRSIAEENLIEKQHFQEHHRSTRHALYKKIKLYLSSKGLDGESCVLKSLCETKQNKSTKPGSIISEIVKAVFTLPASHEKVTNEIHQRYDEAFSDSKNCIEQFPGCKESVWKADFIL